MTSFLLRWRTTIASTDGPASPTTRHVLLTLSLRGNLDGTRIFPSTKLIAESTGLSERSVCTHLERAEQEGWIERSQTGAGQGWRRTIYVPRLPTDALNKVQHEGTEGGSAPDTERTEPVSEGAEPDDTNVLKEVQSTSSVDLFKTSVPPSEATEPARNWTAEAVEVWVKHMGGAITHGRVGKALKPLADAHGADEVLRVLDLYLAEHVKSGRGRFATLNDLAAKFGLYQSGQHRSGSGYRDPASGEDYHALAASIHGEHP